jgi:hypothetical protein
MDNLSILIDHISNSIDNACYNVSKINTDILNIDGMSGDKTRHLLNNICNLSDIHYLEVGSWKGSSFVSAMYKNNIFGTAIDNWEEFGGPSIEFNSNISNFLQKQINNINLLEKDCFSVTIDEIKRPIDIYMFDGHHDYENHKKAITYYKNFFSKFVIIIIDDWSPWDFVRDGTFDGIKEANLKIHYQKEIHTNIFHTKGNNFWNGCGIFICEREDI